MAEESKITVSGVGKRAVRRDEYSDAPLKGGKKWDAFKTAFRLGTEKTPLFKIMLLSALAVLLSAPGIAWVISFTALFVDKVGVNMPYGALDGIGYPSGDILTQGLNSAVLLGNMRYYQYALIEFAVLIPCIVVAALGVGGLTYVARLSMNGEPIKIVRHFFRGIRYTWASSVIAGLLVGANIFLIVFCTYVFDAYSLGLAGKIVTMIFSFLLLVFVVIYAFYLITLAANYKMPLWARLKDAAVLTFRPIVTNLFSAVFVALIAGGATALILWMGSMSTFGTIVWFLLFFFGFYAIATIFVVFHQTVFNKYITEGMLERESHEATERSYAAIRAQKAAGERPKKKNESAPVRYVNPKKKKKTDESAKTASVGKTEEKPAKKKAGKGYTEEELKQLEEDKRKLAEETVAEPSEPIEDMSMYEDDGE